ncbi:MAG: CsbD family protein, partial [Betaproteobacteria bacterium]
VVAGKITGDAKTQADGYVRQVAGKIQKAYGNLKDAARKSR